LIVKKVLVFALVGSFAIGASAHASVFGQFTPAETLPVNAHLFGTYLIASKNVVGAMAQLRLSFYPGVDFGFQGGLSRVDAGSTNRTTVRLGGDFKIAAMHAGTTSPVDLGIGGAIGIENGDDYSTLMLGPSAVASRSFPMGSSSAIVPYAGMMLAFSTINSGPLDQTDFSLPLRLGAELRAAPGFRISTEMELRLGDEINDDVGFAIGANFPF
jgi:hypothetical protein